tara:strand:+ start:2428 stop:2838 length:411 start_codon:yes stop_codon:yes gene_type:complete
MTHHLDIQPQNTNLIETTTELQASRGNRQFFCQQHKVSYISYANGYVRREINAEYCNPSVKVPHIRELMAIKVKDQFVINRRKSTLKSYGWGVCKTQKVIKEHCAQNRMDMIDRISANYKGYTGRFTSTGHTLTVR